MKIKVLLLLTIFSLSTCNNKEEEGITYDVKGYGHIYNTFKFDNGIITPKYNQIENDYNSFNKGIKAYIFKTDYLNIKSFLAFPQNYHKGSFISFSDDTLSLGQILTICVYDSIANYKIFHKGKLINENEINGKLHIYYIPALKTGLDTVVIKNTLQEDKIKFIYWGTEQIRIKKDSLLFYSSTPDGVTDLESLIKNTTDNK